MAAISTSLDANVAAARRSFRIADQTNWPRRNSGDIRPIMGTFFAVAVLRGHRPDPHAFFGTAFWIGFTMQTIAAEVWIHYTRTAAVTMDVAT
jgi:hypothetical protein